MIKRVATCFKDGLYIAADSFVMVYQHPALLSYYAILLLLSFASLIIAYNIGCHTHFLGLSCELEIHAHKLLAELSSMESILYSTVLFSILFNIFLRSFLGVALVKHAYTILNSSTTSIRQSLHHAQKHLFIIIKWALCVMTVTLLARSISLLPLHAYMIFSLTSAILFVWSLTTFFILPIISLQHQSIIKSVQTSSLYIYHTIITVCGGLLWIGMFLLLSLATLALLDKLLPAKLFTWIEYLGIFGMDATLSTVTLIFKTKLYTEYQKEKISPTDQAQTDYSQF